MRKFVSTFIGLSLVAASTLVLLTEDLRAQGFGQPLTIQGLDHFTLPSAASRGEGGIIVGLQNDVSTMFVDPTSLQSLQSLQVSLGDHELMSSANQTQQYGPLKYYSNFSLLMEGLTGYISNPQYDTSTTYNAGDTVQRPYDNIPPNWAHSKTKVPSVQGYAGLPFSFGGMKFAVGIGSIEYADLNWYFQNNNVLSPSILSVKNSTITLPPNNSDSLSIPVQWYQSTQSRVGSIYGYGLALSSALSEKIFVGVSGMILSGSSDDFESRVDRGKLMFYNSYFRLDSIYNNVTSIGTSDYTGQEFTVSARYQSDHVQIGVSIKAPTTITRKYHAVITADTAGFSSIADVSGQDKTTIPFRGSLGLSIALRENLIFGVGYDVRPYSSATFTNSAGSKTNPWLSANLFHVGMEFLPVSWLALRAGAREDAEVYEPVGNPIEGDPVSYSVYSFGIGVKYADVSFNAAFEYSDMKYTDTWADAVSINRNIQRNVIADVSYAVPW
ncbi:MAG TPA: hypothetical protein VMM58_06315 [Bacteroidota bacterium]|nr:hypothetical protein [Bacteroidota bacterium]